MAENKSRRLYSPPRSSSNPGTAGTHVHDQRICLAPHGVRVSIMLMGRSGFLVNERALIPRMSKGGGC